MVTASDGCPALSSDTEIHGDARAGRVIDGVRRHRPRVSKPSVDEAQSGATPSGVDRSAPRASPPDEARAADGEQDGDGEQHSAARDHRRGGNWIRRADADVAGAGIVTGFPRWAGRIHAADVVDVVAGLAAGRIRAGPADWLTGAGRRDAGRGRRGRRLGVSRRRGRRGRRGRRRGIGRRTCQRRTCQRVRWGTRLGRRVGW